MKILIAGSHGMIGAAVTRSLVENGHEIIRLVRHAPGADEVQWDPDAGTIEPNGIEGFDAVIHLASMPWPMRWTRKAKQQIHANRLATNGLLARSLAGCEHKPRVLICASGMGYYPSSGDNILTEDSPAGNSFLAKLQQEGEAASSPAIKAGIRVVHLRIPPVLGGSALKHAGFQAGNGQQWMSWVGLSEMASIIEFTLTTESLTGPVNTTSPNPLRSAEYARRSALALGKKPGVSLPAFLVRLMMGEMGDEFILSSRRIQPAKLLAAGYKFRFPDIEDALLYEMKILKMSMASQPA